MSGKNKGQNQYLTFQGEDNFNKNSTNSDNEDNSYGEYHEEVRKSSSFSFQFLFSKILYILTGIVILLTLGIIVGILIFMSARPSKELFPEFKFDDMFNSSFGVRTWDISWTTKDNDDYFLNYYNEDQLKTFSKVEMSHEFKKKFVAPNDASCSLRIFSKTDDVGTPLISATDLATKSISCGTPYQFDPNLKFIAFKTQAEHVFRHSTKGKYVVWDVQDKKWFDISTEQKQLTLNLCSQDRAYWIGEDNNIYLYIPSKNKHIQITNDGVKELAFNGISDWIYEEDVWETDVLFSVSKDCNRIAFLHLDDNNVDSYNYETYDPENPYPVHSYTKYPTAGKNIPKVNVQVATCNDDACTNNYKHELTENGPEGLGWIFQLVWTSKDQLLYSTTNRIQTELFTYVWNAVSGSVRPLSHETAEQRGVSWIQYPKDIVAVSEYSFVQTYPTNDYYHLRFCKFTENQNCTYTQITNGLFNVMSVIAVRGNTIYYSATSRKGDDKLRSTTSYIYSYDLDTAKESLLKGQDENDANLNYYSASISLSGKSFVLNYEGPDIPHSDLVILNEDKYTISVKESNELLTKLFKTNANEYPVPEVLSRRLNDTDMDLILIKPKNFNNNIKYPVLFFFYGGPGSKQVTQQFAAQRNPFSMYMAAQGFVVATLDNRGTGRKTISFLQCTYQKLGVIEGLDQNALKDSLSEESWIDPKNIMLWGWSFGGFLTLKTSIDPKFKNRDTIPFRAAAAVAPVTDWAYYNAAYTERFMRTPQLNPEGYFTTSIVQNVIESTLNGTNLLLQHGSGDDNVHPLNSLNLITKLQDNEIQFNFMFYPNKDHSISGVHTRRFLYKKIGNHFINSVSN